MKRLWIFLWLIAFLPVHTAHSQMFVIDAAVATVLEKTKIDQGIHYAQMVLDNVEQIALLGQQIEHMYNTVKMAAQNLQSLGDIEDFKDFMDWYNRQLYYERMTIETFNGMNVNIGKKNYKLTDIEGMAYGVKETYFDYWENEFTEEQRREMWLSLGLTPANYAYVQPFREKGRELARKFLTAGEIQNRKYMNNMERNNERQKKLAKDKNLGIDEKMGEKEILMMIAETSIANNEALQDLIMLQTDLMAKQAVDMFLEETPASGPQFSKWTRDGFRALTKKEAVYGK